jgi:hypothetical protein
MFHMTNEISRDSSQLYKFPIFRKFKMAAVLARQNPGFVRELTRERAKSDKLLGLSDNSRPPCQFALDHLAEHASAMLLEVVGCPMQFVLDLSRHDRGRDHLAVGVFQRGSGGRARVLEDLSVSQPRITTPMGHPVPVSKEHQTHLLLGQLRQAGHVVRALDDDLVDPHTVPGFEEIPFGGPLVSHVLDRRKLVGDHSHLPQPVLDQSTRLRIGSCLLGGVFLVAPAKRASTRSAVWTSRPRIVQDARRDSGR